MSERFTLRRQREALVRTGLQPVGDVVGLDAREGQRISFASGMGNAVIR